jgi:hypothetical protein
MRPERQTGKEEIRMTAVRLCLRFAGFAGSAGSIVWVTVTMLSLSAAVAEPATATVMYQYTGKPYATATTPYTTAMSINGTITLTNQLAPGLTNQDFATDISNNGYSFTDGVNTYNLVNDGPLALGDARFSTNSSGAITAWIFAATQKASNMTMQMLSSCTPATQCDRVINGSNTAFLATNTTAGTWSLVPEPTTLTLTAIGLSALVAATRRRRA